MFKLFDGKCECATNIWTLYALFHVLYKFKYVVILRGCEIVVIIRTSTLGCGIRDECKELTSPKINIAHFVTTTGILERINIPIILV